jgi:hypothetical protein
MSNANYIRVSIVEESTYGTTPASPVFLILPTTGQTMRDRVGYQQSQTIRSDRNIKDLVRLTKAAGGGLPCELTFSGPTEALGQAIRAVLCSAAESTAVTVSGNSADEGDDFVERGSGSWVSDGFEVGDIVKVTGNQFATDDGYYKVTGVDTLVLTLEGALWTGTDASVTVVRGARMKNGVTERSYSVEVARTDIDIAQIFTGCVFDSMAFTVADEAITTANFTLQAASSTRVDAPVSGTGAAALYVAGATYTSPAVNPVLDALSVPEFQVAGLAYAAKSIGMTLGNNAMPRTQIGSLGPQSMKLGSFNATGTFQAYMDGFDDFDDYALNNPTDFWLVMEDANGKGWSFSFPEAKFSDVGADTNGLDQEDYKNGSVQAYLDSVEGCTVRVQRWA